MREKLGRGITLMEQAGSLEEQVLRASELKAVLQAEACHLLNWSIHARQILADN